MRRDREERPLDDYSLEDEYDDDDPNNPHHRDFDLSESAPYDFDSWTDDKPWFMRRWALLTVSGLVVISLGFSLILPHLV